MRNYLRLLILLALLALLAAAAFRHFVTCRIADRGGMENPDFTLVVETLGQ